MKQKQLKNDQPRLKKRYLVTAIISAFIFVGGVGFTPVFASIQDQINQLQRENAKTSKKLRI